jgi:hypothetical protein
VAIDKNRMRTLLGRGAQWHGGMHAKLARFIRGGRDYAALVALPANHHGFAFQRGIKQLFHGHKKCVHIDVKDDSAGGGHILEDTPDGL